MVLNSCSSAASAASNTAELGMRGASTPDASRCYSHQNLAKIAKPNTITACGPYGPGGLGKTRLLIELIQDLTEEGWLAGFVNYDVLGHPVRGPQFENLVRDGCDAQGLLLVVDYAEGRAEEVKALARLIIERERAGRAPARLVLLSRAAGDWWHDLSGRNPDVALLFTRKQLFAGLAPGCLARSRRVRSANTQLNGTSTLFRAIRNSSAVPAPRTTRAVCATL
jgi:hypothetical protein